VLRIGESKAVYKGEKQMLISERWRRRVLCVLVKRRILNINMGIFVKLGLKITSAAYVFQLPSLETTILEGMGYIENLFYFMSCN